MEKHVPEEKKVPSEEKQIEALRKELIGNRTFRSCRGKLFDVFFKIVEKSENPTQFCSMWDGQTPDMLIMGNLLAKYKRDGWIFAYESLKNALMSDDYLFPEEIIPINQTIPFTAVMLEPKKTLTLVNWLLSVHWCELNCYLDEKDGATGLTFHSSGLTHKLFENFPSLEEFCRERRMYYPYEGADLLKAYEKEICKSFGEDIFQDMESLKGQGLHLIQGQWNDHVEEVHSMYFVYAFPAEAKDILCKFNREQQKKMAVWTFNFPKIQMWEGFRPAIGLHVEQEQKKWFNKYPMNVSLNVSHGLGAVLNHSRIDDEKYELNKCGNYVNDKNCPIPERFALSRYM